jgi:parallel beta-helix repeat protein
MKYPNYCCALPLGLFFLLLVSACGQKDERSGVVWKNIEKKLQTELILANPGDTIFLEEGYFWFTKGLQLEGKSNIVIKGAGIDKTILSFKGQEEGAEGIKIANCIDIELIDFTIEDAKGDNIKVTETDGIYFRRIKAYWTGGAKSENGAYGLYPVLCRNVLIEDCIAARASDAGIYVGQSDSVVIRRNVAYENVAGIESENSTWVDIYDNQAFNNTGGILIFDLPGLTKYGSHTRVFNNTVTSNNHNNFAPKGNIVGTVPPGTGIMLLATRAVEIFDNSITHNRTASIALTSYELVLAMEGDNQDDNSNAPSIAAHNQNYQLDSLYNPYINQVYIHSNIIKNKHWFPTLQSDFGKLLLWKRFMNTPHILYDGFKDPEIQSINLCLQQNGEIKFLNINAPNNLKKMEKDWSTHHCKGEALTPTEVRDPKKRVDEKIPLSI